MTVAPPDSQMEQTERQSVCNLLDKLLLQNLHLMEDRMACEIKIESVINSGSIHLAKSRYIMGHNSVSASQIPVESSSGFNASVVCDRGVENGVPQITSTVRGEESNPIKWFGVLVPQNLKSAQAIFKNAINYVIECTNIQLQILDNNFKIHSLRKLKKELNS